MSDKRHTLSIDGALYVKLLSHCKPTGRSTESVVEELIELLLGDHKFKGVVTQAEAAKALNTTPRTVARYRRMGLIKQAFKGLPGPALVDEASVDAFRSHIGTTVLPRGPRKGGGKRYKPVKRVPVE